ncbi:gamma-glutamyl-gamma-aminobutyrate hydrolase family protein [Catenulispora yoronensis]|uniref:Gamma-glutamyl-gamma-aminobutyrate hydrolase family protein n=1 Tax=Catenulispora yoronensis TaxID=450799 RepID=A0ABP5FPJ5_9ACTN
MPAPLIGMSSYQETATWGPWRNVPAALLPNRYVESVTRVGGLPLLLPPHLEAHDAQTLKEQGAQAVAVLDGLILTGGPDIDPVGYGAVRHLDTDSPRKDRDAWEYALLAAALERDLPVLAICRGFQLLNAALGGTLRQHLPDEAVFGNAHRQQLGQYAAVRIDLDPAAPPGRDLGAHIIAWCHHHQGIDKLGAGLESTGNAPDGLIEAGWMPGKTYVVGVQWHPEEDSKPELFRSLIDAATRYAKGR